MPDLDQLAQRFRPYLKFSVDGRQQENHRPCSWRWFYQHSLLILYAQAPAPYYRIPIERIHINTNYDIVLEKSSVRRRANGASNAWWIYIDEDSLHGESWASVRAGEGLYCHATEIDSQLVNLEYWTLFAYNKTSVIGDHRGDLTCVQMVYDRNVDGIVRVSFLIHGKAIEAFQLPSSAGRTAATLRGRDAGMFETSVSGTKFQIPSDHAYQQGPSWHSPSQRVLYFVADPVTGRHEHLAVFHEWGSHEPWPNEAGSVFLAPSHNGSGYSFLPERVTLLDPQRDAPFVYFGGKLGDPTSIIRHRAWFLSEPGVYLADSMRTDRDPYCALGRLRWPPVLSGRAGTNQPTPSPPRSTDDRPDHPDHPPPPGRDVP